MKYLKQTISVEQGEFEAPEGYRLFTAQYGSEKRHEHTITVNVPVWFVVWAPANTDWNVLKNL